MKKVFILFAITYLIATAASAQQFVDLGLPSGTLWKSTNETGGFVTHVVAMAKYKGSIPTEEQWKELIGMCEWSWTGKGAKVIGLNGNSIFLPAAGYFDDDGDIREVGYASYYWMSNSSDRCEFYSFYQDYNDKLQFYNSARDNHNSYPDRCLYKMSVRLVSK